MAKPNEKLKPGYHWECKYCDYTRGVPYPDEPDFLVCGRCGAEWEDIDYEEVKEKTMQEKVLSLEQANQELATTVDSILTEVIPSLMGV